MQVEAGLLGLAVSQSWNLALGAGETIVSAFFTSTFGNSVVNSTATGLVTIGAVQVASWAGPGNAGWDGPSVHIAVSFAAGNFASLRGAFDLIHDQTGCCVIRLGASLLTIKTTSVSAVPLPASLPLAGLRAVEGSQRIAARLDGRTSRFRPIQGKGRLSSGGLLR